MLPPITNQHVLDETGIDATPDGRYAIRILQRYRILCNSRWATDADGSCNNPFLDLMNKHCDQRAEELDKAISILEREL